MLDRLSMRFGVRSSVASQPLTRWARLGVVACMMVALLAVLSLLPYTTSGTELVRLRNALSLGDALPPDFDWHPPQQAGHGYLIETSAPATLFVGVAQSLRLSEQVDDWQRALVISRHLLGSAPRLNGGAIQSDLQTTYHRIVEQGDGYCGDFVRAFLAISHAGGMTVRSWAFSFDGFGGHGHIWVELWNRQQQAWQLIDIFNNLFFTREGTGPLSALQLREALLLEAKDLRLNQLYPGPYQVYDSEARVWDYIRRGIDQWYLNWGNNVQGYDQALLVRALGSVSRSMTQLGGIVQGVQPAIRILLTPGNQAMARELRYLRWQLLAVALVVPTALTTALVLAWGTRVRGAK